MHVASPRQRARSGVYSEASPEGLPMQRLSSSAPQRAAPVERTVTQLAHRPTPPSATRAHIWSPRCRGRGRGAHVEADHAGHVAQPAPRLPAGAGARRGLRHRGHRRQPLPGLRRRHRGQLHGPRAPTRWSRRSSDRPADLLHYSASDFYLPIYAELCEPAGGRRADDGPRARLPRQQRHRGRGGVGQAGPRRDPSAVRGRPSWAASTAAPTARSA